MDALTYLFSRLSLKAGVFYTGPICGVHDFEQDESRGHVHLFHRGRVRIQGEDLSAPVDITEPTLVFMPRPKHHRLDIAEDEEVEVLCGTVSLGFSCDNPLSDSLPAVLMAPLSALPRVTQLTDLLFAEAFEAPEGRQGVLDRLCEILIIKLLRYGMSQGLIHGGALAGLLDPRLSKALMAMHENPALSWSIAEMAAAAGMSRARFAAHFTAVVGESPADYLTGWRVLSAQHLMQRGMQMKQVCVEVGYGSSSAFTRAFARKVGASPSDWLKQNASR